MENEPNIDDLSEEQKTQIKALESKVFKHTIRRSARNCFMLLGAGFAVGLINLRFVHSDAFLMAGGIANAILFVRQIRLDFLEENKMIAEELEKIFK